MISMAGFRTDTQELLDLPPRSGMGLSLPAIFENMGEGGQSGFGDYVLMARPMTFMGTLPGQAARKAGASALSRSWHEQGVAYG